MPDAKPPAALPPATVEAILTAASPSTRLSPTQEEAVSGWLSEEWNRAIRRARTEPLSRDDVNRFDRAYASFRAVIEDLQNRTLAPPRIPAPNGTTAWDDWREIYEQFGFIGGRGQSADWLLIGALLALYETVSGRAASASQPSGPTMRFLDSAMREMANHAPPELRSYFACPKVDALKKQLPGLNRLALWHAKRQLGKAIGSAG